MFKIHTDDAVAKKHTFYFAAVRFRCDSAKEEGKLKGILKYLLSAVFLTGHSVTVFAADPVTQNPDLYIPHATTVNGLTGLIYTNSTYTLPKGQYEIGTGVRMERSSLPTYAELQTPLYVTYGLSDNIELGFTLKSVYRDTVGQGLGDTQIHVKWRVLEPAATRQGDYLPAVALGAGIILPTAKSGLKEVNDLGAKLMFMLASEGRLPNDRYLGLYLDGRVIAKDLNTTSALKDTYWVLNMGLLLPYQDQKEFQIIGELNFVGGRKETNPGTLGADNYNGLTLGLRYASDTIRASTGVQFVNKLNTGIKDTSRVIATASIEF